MARNSLLLFCVLASGCAAFKPPENWSREDTRREIYYLAALAGDSYTTAQIHKYPHLREANPFVAAVIGERPEPAEVWTGAAVAALVHYIVARRLPAKWRPAWQFGPVILHGSAAVANCGITHECVDEP